MSEPMRIVRPNLKVQLPRTRPALLSIALSIHGTARQVPAATMCQIMDKNAIAGLLKRSILRLLSAQCKPFSSGIESKRVTINYVVGVLLRQSV